MDRHLPLRRRLDWDRDRGRRHPDGPDQLSSRLGRGRCLPARSVVGLVADGRRRGRSGRSGLASRPSPVRTPENRSVADRRGRGRFLEQVDPVTFVTVGTREYPPGRPPEMSVFNVFFDSPAKRPHQSYRARLDPKAVRSRAGRDEPRSRSTGSHAGPFAGRAAGQRLRRGPARPRRGGCLHASRKTGPSFTTRAWRRHRPRGSSSPGSTRRVTFAATRRQPRPRPTPSPSATARSSPSPPGGSVACFPPPHQYFFPRDLTDNQKTVWFGPSHRNLEPRTGSASARPRPAAATSSPGSTPRPGPSSGSASSTCSPRQGRGRPPRDPQIHARRPLPRPARPVTFTSHWHMAITVAAMKAASPPRRPTMPDSVAMFKDMNVNIVHLAEFHGDGHPRRPRPAPAPRDAGDVRRVPAPLRPNLLFLPGEEANAVLPTACPRQAHRPLALPLPAAGLLDHEAHAAASRSPRAWTRSGRSTTSASKADMVRLLKTEHGLAWTAHPRIKASNWTPDVYRDEDFFKDPTLARRRVEGHARRPLPPSTRRTRARPARRHGQLGQTRSTCPARSTSSRSTIRTSFTAT